MSSPLEILTIDSLRLKKFPAFFSVSFSLWPLACQLVAKKSQAFYSAIKPDFVFNPIQNHLLWQKK
jgi:hypothetical protein